MSCRRQDTLHVDAGGIERRIGRCSGGVSQGVIDQVKNHPSGARRNAEQSTLRIPAFATVTAHSAFP